LRTHFLKMVRQRKEKWRKVVPEVDGKLEDKRAVAPLLERDDLFTEDTVGSLKGLSRSVRKAIAKDPHGTGKKPPSKQEMLKIAKASQALKTNAQRPKKVEEPEFLDIWGEDANKKKPKFAYAVRRIEEENTRGRGRSGMKATSLSPAVMPPKSGHSFNPSSEDLEALLVTAAAKERTKDEENVINSRHRRPMTAMLLDNFTDEEISKMTEPEKQQKFLQLSREQSGIVLNEDDEDDDAAGPRKGLKRKSRADRNKAMKNKIIKEIETEGQKEKKMLKSIGKTKEMLTAMKTEAGIAAEKRAYGDQVKAQEAEEIKSGHLTKNKRVSKHVFEEAPVEVVYDAEGRKTLREISKVSAIKTHVDSFYRRNMMDAPAPNSRANARKVLKRVRKAKMKNKYVAQEMKDRSLLM